MIDELLDKDLKEFMARLEYYDDHNSDMDSHLSRCSVCKLNYALKNLTSKSRPITSIPLMTMKDVFSMVGAACEADQGIIIRMDKDDTKDLFEALFNENKR
jgi:hypothetical protein